MEIRDFVLPEGFTISEFAVVPGARSLVALEGMVLVGTREQARDA